MEHAAPHLAGERTQQTELTPHTLRESLAPLVKASNERSRSAYGYADRQLHAHPLGSAGAVFGFGVAFGVLVALAARRRH